MNLFQYIKDGINNSDADKLVRYAGFESSDKFYIQNIIFDFKDILQNYSTFDSQWRKNIKRPTLQLTELDSTIRIDASKIPARLKAWRN